MSKPRKTCKKCGAIAIQVSGEFLANYFVDDLCVVCREHNAYGMPEWATERLHMWAAAYRAANKCIAIVCMANGCKKPARPWWYVCGTRCRDKLVKEML